VSRLRPSRTLAAVVLTLALGATATACGGSDIDPDDTGALGTSTDAPKKPSETRTKKPHKTKPPKAAPTVTDEGGDGDPIGDDRPVTAGGGACTEISPSEVATITGGGVKGAALPGGGCVFSHADRRAPEVTIKDQPYSGMDAAKAEATSAVEGEPEDLSGIGRAAFVVTGSIFGGTEIQGAGAVRVGGRVISVSLVQHKAMSRAAVRDMVIRLLKLIASP
jgi:hypothetical protein